MCVNRMLSRNDLNEAIVAAHHSGKGYKDISNQFEVHHSRVRDY